MSRLGLPILGQAPAAPDEALSAEDAAFLQQRPEVSTPQFLKAVIEDEREEVARMIIHDERLVHSRDASGATAIQLACYHGLDEMAGVLVRSEVALDLWEAAAVGDAARVAAVLDAEPALRDAFSEDGFPALVLASYLGHAAAVDELIGRGADVALGARNALGMMALHGACATANPDAGLAIARRLLDVGAPIDAVQAGGFAALHLAASRGRRPLVELLLATGADPTLESDLDLTPRDLALERGHAEVAALLELPT